MKSNGKAYVIVAVLLAIGAIVYMAVGGLGKNLVYYWSPTELRDFASRPPAEGANARAVVRLGGEVKPGTIVRGSGASDLSFVITDGAHDVTVHSSAVPPQMFREGIGVVVEGVLADDGTFTSEQIMVKHGNDYQPPKAGEKPNYAPPEGAAGTM